MDEQDKLAVIIRLAERAIDEKRRPDSSELCEILDRGAATPKIIGYVYTLNEGPLPRSKGKPPKSTNEKQTEYVSGLNQIRDESKREIMASGRFIKITEAIDKASGRANGLSKSKLWDIYERFNRTHKGEKIIPDSPED